VAASRYMLSPSAKYSKKLDAGAINYDSQDYY
jgi:hypothetical protein